MNPLVIAEVLVNDRLAPWLLKPAEQISQCLDMCTGNVHCKAHMEGNGSLAILAADVFQNAQIDAVDVSPQALEVAKINLNNLVESTRYLTSR